MITLPQWAMARARLSMKANVPPSPGFYLSMIALPES